MKEVLLLTLLGSLSTPLVAQRDTLWHKDLKEVAITAERSQLFTIGHRSESPDSILKLHNKFSMLSSLLDATSGLVVRSYGPGILATSSLRGGNAQQTALSWNGIAINNPVNGLCDLNLVPSFLFDRVNVQAGLTGTLQGSGAISGAINLSNPSISHQGSSIEVIQAIGSFGSFNEGLSVRMVKNKWRHVLKINLFDAKNNYSYMNTTEAGNPKRSITHAKSRVYSAMHELAYHSSKTGHISLSYWGTFAQRQIPPSMLMGSSDAFQADHNHRLKLQWQKSFRKMHINYHSYYQNDKLLYTEFTSDINSITKSSFATNDLEARFKTLKNSRNGIGLIHTYAQAYISNILPLDTVIYNTSNRQLFAIWLSHIQKIPKLNTTISASIRSEILNAKTLPLTPSIGINTRLKKSISFYGQVCRVFRFPTLNDLHWIPGGNPNLKPESGWAQELTTEYHSTKPITNCTLSITGFNRNIANWIQWQPITSQIWSPFNLGQVKSYGIEIRGNYSKHLSKKTIARVGFSLDYTQSKNIDPTHVSYGKQLLYVPYFKSTGFIAAIYSNTCIVIQGITVGKRYTQSDNLDSLPLYGLLNLSLSQSIKCKKQDVHLFVKANNLLNQSYQAIVWRPMPGINFEFGITLQILSKSKKIF